jgi:hypothetical protein
VYSKKTARAAAIDRAMTSRAGLPLRDTPEF